MLHKQMVKFGKKYVEKRKLYSAEEPTDVNGVNIDNILVSNKYHIGKRNFKYFLVI